MFHLDIKSFSNIYFVREIFVNNFATPCHPYFQKQLFKVETCEMETKIFSEVKWESDDDPVNPQAVSPALALESCGVLRKRDALTPGEEEQTTTTVKIEPESGYEITASTSQSSAEPEPGQIKLETEDDGLLGEEREAGRKMVNRRQPKNQLKTAREQMKLKLERVLKQKRWKATWAKMSATERRKFLLDPNKAFLKDIITHYKLDYSRLMAAHGTNSGSNAG